jgi:predicted Fe-S protein YdhL (DUF1289 family)
VSEPYDDFESPCVRTCVIDQQSGYCHGCARTLHEISYWTRYTSEERQRILRELPVRQIVHIVDPTTPSI